MNEDDLEELHLRRRFSDMLDALEAGRITIAMGVIYPMAFMPVGDSELDRINEVIFTELLMDFVDNPVRREDVLQTLVELSIDELQAAALRRELVAAIEALAARGRIVTPFGLLNRFQIDGAGDYSAEDILDEAAR